MMLSKESNLISILIASAILLALLYVIQINRLAEGAGELKRQKSISQALNLAYQNSTTKLSFMGLEKDFERLQEKFQLIEVKGFGFLEPEPSQLSLNPKMYE